MSCGKLVTNELELRVPHGKLAAKTWFEETEGCKRILALHGWQDNSATFDRLIPGLKHEKGLFVFALDLVGHGKSSQLPAGVSYGDMTFVMEIRRCLTALNWIQPAKPEAGAKPVKRFSILGHGLGAGVGLFYASLFPDDVEEVIAIDFIKTRTMPKDRLLDETAVSVDSFVDLTPTIRLDSFGDVIEADKNLVIDKGSVVLSQENAIKAILEGRKKRGNLNREQALCLLERSTTPVESPPNSVKFTRDLRLDAVLAMREDLKINQILFGRDKCRLLFILAKKGLYTEKDFADNLDTMVETYKQRAKSFHVQWLNADHYVHLNQPEKVTDIINKYLKSPETYQVFEDK